MRSPLTRMKSAPCSSIALPVGGSPIIDPWLTKALVERWFGEIPKGAPVEPIAPPPAVLTSVKRQTMTDRCGCRSCSSDG